MFASKRTSSKKTSISATKIDKSLITLILIFLVFGLIIIYDATVVLSQNLYGNAYRFVLLQLAWIVAGLLGFFFFAKLPLTQLKKLATPLFFISLSILGVLALFGVLPCDLNFMFAPCVNGANRWFYLNPSPLPQLPVLGVLGFQPSEFAKFSLVLFLAARLEKSIRLKESPFVGFLVPTALFAFLIFLQPNLSTATLIFVIGVSMFLATGSELKSFILSLPIFGILGGLFMISSTYRRQRLLTFLSFGDEGELSVGYHIKQIQIALGSGGFFGLGFGQSRQKFQYLPEVFADSIFAIIGEELGFVGTTLLITMFALLVYKGFTIAQNTEDMFGKLLAVGITSWIAIQFFVNIAAMTKFIPLTGIPLPLISYGGSSLVFILMGLGILANISRYQNTDIKSVKL